MFNVKLISYTKPAEDLDLSDDLLQLVSFCARVSNPDNQYNEKTSEKLVNYLIKEKHWSPFEMVNVCLEIETTRDISRQILRHRSFSFQEFSQRYAGVVEKPDVLAVRRQDQKNRQASIDDIDPFTKQDFQVKAQMLYDISLRHTLTTIVFDNSDTGETLAYLDYY